MIKISSKRDGFRRAGVAHAKAGKTYPDDFFDFDQLEQLKADPMLTVTTAPDPETNEASVTRKVLEGYTNDRLKKQCDAMGIEYPKAASKVILVDLILDNTAPAPEE